MRGAGAIGEAAFGGASGQSAQRRSSGANVGPGEIVALEKQGFARRPGERMEKAVAEIQARLVVEPFRTVEIRAFDMGRRPVSDGEQLINACTFVATLDPKRGFLFGPTDRRQPNSPQSPRRATKGCGLRALRVLWGESGSLVQRHSLAWLASRSLSASMTTRVIAPPVAHAIC
jgi:hypothetical protein